MTAFNAIWNKPGDLGLSFGQRAPRSTQIDPETPVTTHIVAVNESWEAGAIESNASIAVKAKAIIPIETKNILGTRIVIGANLYSFIARVARANSVSYSVGVA